MAARNELQARWAMPAVAMPARRPTLESVQSVFDYTRNNTTEGHCPPTSVELCVLSVVPFPNGWRCALADREGFNYDFEMMKAAINGLSPRERGQYVLELTVWRPTAGHYHISAVPGALVFIRDVYDLKIINRVCYGAADFYNIF